MRRITRNYNSKPRSLTLNTSISKWNDIANRVSTVIEREIYSDPYYDHNKHTASRVIDHLNRWYHLKCAYCERFYKLDVEHYRPKGEVRDGNNKLIMITPTDAHPGYYWLCYEWSNLVPACISCNRDGGKGSKFPTIISYTSTPPINAGVLDTSRCFVGHPDLTVEQPYLLHPEHDDPTGMFRFEVAVDKKGIKMVGTDAPERAEMTIKICQMNRPEIRMDRFKTVITPIRKTLIALMKQLSGGHKTIQQIRSEMNTVLQKLYEDANDVTLDHTYLRKYIIQSSANFEGIVIPFIPKPLQQVLLTAFNSYTPLL